MAYSDLGFPSSSHIPEVGDDFASVAVAFALSYAVTFGLSSVAPLVHLVPSLVH